YHVAVVFERETGVTMYLDGSAVGSLLSVTELSENPFSKQLYFMSDIQRAHRCSGILSDVRIWDRALTETEIQQQKNERLHGTEAGLIGYWKLNNGVGSTAIDATENNNNGAIYGAVWLNHPVEPY
ncbi:MAG: hypothetical protein KDD04_06400, partial [Sinomicrobium sp.]|nr:hypothetical protein [Sinomicrobium sp.]